MNLFILSEDARAAARAHGDKHVIKMMLEACQMLYTAHWVAAFPSLLENKSAVAVSKAQKELPLPVRLLTAPKQIKSGEPGYRPVHLHHPCTVWIRSSLANYYWACNLALALAAEYEFRWPGRVHSCKAHAKWLLLHPPKIPHCERTPFALAMDDMYKISSDAVENYRNYYKTSKQERGLTKYTDRSPPEWL
jgi:hypothetical protein